MPFTPTHVLAVVPVAALARAALPFAALAVGSMVPDVPLFVPFAPGYAVTHSFPGLFTACLPMGVAGFVVFEWVMKRPLLALLPEAARRRCGRVARPGPAPSIRSAAAVSAAVVLGALTHVVWDAFTHHGRWGTRLLPWLNTTVLTLAGWPLRGYKLLQFGSAAVGLPLLGLLALAWLGRQPVGPDDDPAPAAPGVRLGAAVAVLAIPWLATDLVCRRRGLGVIQCLGPAIMASALALGVAVLAYCAAYQAWAARARARG